MSPTVRLPAPLRGYAGNAAEMDVAADSVAAAIDELVRRSPGLAAHLIDERGQLRGYVTVFVNEDDIRALDGPATRLAARDTVLIVPTIAGGGPAAVTSRRA
jgi:molybdopterin converting factor small subunit